MKLSASDPYIYRIFRSSARGGGGYVGQDSGTGIRAYNRIFDHIDTAYELKNTSNSGGSAIIKEGGASELCFDVYSSEDNCFGCGEENFQQFNEVGKSGADLKHQKLTFAEMVGICAGMVTGDSDYNTWIGDKSFFTCDLDAGLKDILEQIYTAEEGKDIMAGTGVKLGKVQMHIPDSKENVEKLLNPEYYAIVRAFSYALTYRLFRGEQGNNGLKENIINKFLSSEHDIAHALQLYISVEKKKEVYRWNKVLPTNYQIDSANVRFNLSQDIERITNYIGDRIGMFSYSIAQSIEEKLGVIIKSVKSSNKQLTFKKHSMSKLAKETFRIKRTAYIDGLKISQELPKGYTNALAIVKTAQPSEKLHHDPEFISKVKQISFEGFKKILEQTIPSCPIRWDLGGTTLTGGRDEFGALNRKPLPNTSRENPTYNREDTLMSRTRRNFFKNKKMHILNQEGQTYYRQCVSIYMKTYKEPLREETDLQALALQPIEARSEQPNSNGEFPRMVKVGNQYKTAYGFKPFTGSGIQENYTQNPDNLKFY